MTVTVMSLGATAHRAYRDHVVYATKDIVRDLMIAFALVAAFVLAGA